MNEIRVKIAALLERAKEQIQARMLAWVLASPAGRKQLLFDPDEFVPCPDCGHASHADAACNVPERGHACGCGLSR